MREVDARHGGSPRARFSFADLHVRLFALVCVAILAPLFVILHGASEQRRLATLNVRAEALRAARIAANHEERTLATARQILVVLAQLDEMRAADPGPASALLADLLAASPGFRNFGVANRGGLVTASALPAPAPTSIADRLYFRRVVETRRFSVGEFQIGRVTNVATLNVAHPILDESGDLAAVVYAALDLAWLADVAAKIQLPSNSVLFMSDDRGTILARHPDPESYVGKSFPDAPVVKTLLATPGEGTAWSIGLDGVERLYAFTSDLSEQGDGLLLGVGIPKTAAFAEVNRITFRSLSLLLLASFVAFAASYLFARRTVLLPVGALLRATRRIGQGDLAARTELPRSSGEIGLLARTFDEMAESLAERSHELETERALLARRVDERTAELVQANAHLARADKAKDEFLASMSHELRTPLNSILGLSESISEGVYGELSAGQRRALRTIEESGRHLLSLINDILDLSKIGADKLELNVSPVLVRDVAEASLRFVREMAAKKRLAVSSRVDPIDAVIEADERRVKQILVNLLVNAVKFAPGGGSIALEVIGSADANELRFTVSDTGPGISKEDQAKLFRPFVQLDAGLARQHSGTGLGLSLVQRLAGLHGGRVELESEVGRGSRFTVTLPWTGAAATAGSATSTSMATRARARAGENADRSNRVKRALIVEDDKDEAVRLERYLREAGFAECEACPAAADVDARVAARRPDVILLDILLPDGSGWDVLARLKSNASTRTIPVIVVSVVDERARARELGAAESLVKPISLSMLRAALAGSEPSEPAAESAFGEKQAPLLLLADDNASNVSTLADYLAVKGYRVVIAADGREAVDRAHETRPEIILMDVQMPGMDGLEATRIIRSTPRLRAIPIIAVTALAMPGDRERCLRAGATEYVSKPVRLQDLVSLVEALRAAARSRGGGDVGPLEDEPEGRIPART